MKSLVAAVLFSCIVFNPSVVNTAQGNPRMLGCENGEVILSNNRTLAPLEMVQASNSLQGGLADIIVADATDVYSSGTSVWCTDNRDPDPYIDLQFTSPVLISRMLTRGYTRLRAVVTCSIRRYYVTNFTLEYSPPDNSSVLNYYTLIDGPETSAESKMYFSAPEFTTLIQFERPFLTRRIRLRPVEWFDGDGTDLEFVCMGVALYGCLQSEVVEQGNFATNPAVMVNDNKALSILLPITLIIIAALIVTVGVLAYLLVRKQKAKKDVRPDSGYTVAFLERSQRSLSDEHSFAVTGMEGMRHETRQSSIIKKVDNPIYGKDRQGSLDGQSHAYSSISDPGYERVDSSKSQTTEGQPRYLEYGTKTATKDGLDAIPEICEDNMRVMVNSSYEPVEIGEHSGATGRVRLEEMASRADSMVDNRAYNRESYDGRVSMPNGDGKEEEEEGEGGGGEYEAIVALQSNSSYNYVTTMPLPSPSRED